MTIFESFSGDLSLAQNKETRDSVCVFLTVHDVGSNHHAWLRFANSPAMAEIREKAVFLHVDLLGTFKSIGSNNKKTPIYENHFTQFASEASRKNSIFLFWRKLVI